MTATLTFTGVEQAAKAFNALVAQVKSRHMRIALSAAGGAIRDTAKRIVRQDTGLLAKSLGVKVPRDPRYAVIGPRRGTGRFMRKTASGKLRVSSEAQRQLRDARTALRRERAAVRLVRASVSGVEYRNPTRYAHIVEKGRSGKRPMRARPFLATAVAVSGDYAMQRFAEKLGTGIESEAKNLAK